ncbi:hypothetical protein BH09BAC1_BH09BAC1_10670 [soil metagenome]
MEILDQSLEELPKSPPINWVGRLFYIGEIVLLMGFVLMVTNSIRFDEDFIFYYFYGLYSAGAITFTLFSGAFPRSADKAFGILASLAFSMVGIPFFFSAEFSGDKMLVVPAFMMALMAIASFVYFLLRLIRRGRETTIWHFLGMVVRIGLMMIPTFVFLFFTLRR